MVAWSADADDIDEQILGGWQLKMTTPDGEYREPLVLVGRQFDRYAAWYVGEQGMEPMKDVQLKDDVLVGNITPKEQPDVSVTLEARLTEKDTCQGVGKYRDANGEEGSWDFTGKKLSLKAAGEVSKWQLISTTSNGEKYKATLMVVARGDEMYGWFSGEDHELPIPKITVDGDQVTMKMSAETREGEQVALTFRATTDGESASGNVEYTVDGGESGSVPFTATLID
jgi:hypothetical protein